MHEFLKISSILIVCFLIIYISLKMIHKMINLRVSVVEGLTTSNFFAKNTVKPVYVAEKAKDYADSLVAELKKLDDELLLKKYNTDYDKTIKALDAYIRLLMVKQTMSINVSGDIKTNIESLVTLNILKNSLDSLKPVMEFLSKFI